MPYKLRSDKRHQYILYVVDRHKGVVKYMHPEESTFDRHGRKVKGEIKKKGKKKKGEEVEEDDEKEVIKEITKRLVFKTFI